MDDVSQPRTTPPVLVVNWNSWDETFQCLRSILESGEDCPVWLIDNGSDVDRSAEAEAIYPGLRVLKLDENYGAVVARNRALKLALQEGYQFAYLLDNDCTVSPGFLSSLVEVATSNVRVAMAGSRIARADVPNSLHFDGRYYQLGEHPIDESDEVRVVPASAVGASLYRLETLDDIGFFDERFFIYGEGVEWCARLSETDWIAVVVGRSLVFHRGHRSDHHSNEQYYRTRNYFLQHERETRAEKLRRQALYVYTKIRAANEQRRAGHEAQARDMVYGLWDGMTGRFGRRINQTPVPAPIAALLVNFWIFPPGFFRQRGEKMSRLARQLRTR